MAEATEILPDLATMEFVIARMMTEEQAADPRCVQRVEASMMDSIDERRLYEELRRSKTLRLKYQGFIRDGLRLELRCRIKELKQKCRFRFLDPDGACRTVWLEAETGRVLHETFLHADELPNAERQLQPVTETETV